MASPRITIPAAVTVGLLFLLTSLIPKTGVDGSRNRIEERKTVLGSKPPGCVNKCKKCRPCKAILVVPTHQKRSFKVLSHDYDRDDDGYYLLSWRCTCGNKLFHP